MDHLFSSVVRVEELQLTQIDGRVVMAWSLAKSPDGDKELDDLLAYLPCRLDLNFLRPGKDIAPAPVAGRAPDRIGIMFTYAFAPLRAGQRIVAIPNDEGRMPVEGTFEIRVIPDKAVDFDDAHHIEVQVLETNQLPSDRWMSDEAPLPDDDEVLP
jgi:hypothetical protein